MMHSVENSAESDTAKNEAEQQRNAYRKVVHKGEKMIDRNIRETVDTALGLREDDSFVTEPGEDGEVVVYRQNERPAKKK